jgi:hypothetical protein
MNFNMGIYNNADRQDNELIRLRKSLKRKCNTINKLRDDIDFDYNGKLHTELNKLRKENERLSKALEKYTLTEFPLNVIAADALKD